jgi:hypothetical protein
MSSDYRYGKPKSKAITPEEYEKLKPYFPPKQRDHLGNEIPWSEDSIPGLIQAAINARDREKERKLYEKQHAE